jgi:hypothetical protein
MGSGANLIIMAGQQLDGHHHNILLFSVGSLQRAFQAPERIRIAHGSVTVNLHIDFLSARQKGFRPW